MQIGLYALRRLLLLVPQLLLISIVTFILIRMLPGDPARLQLGPLAPKAGVEELRRQLKLDQPIPIQYIAYLERLIHGDFGHSWVNQSNVSSDLALRVPATLELIGYGLLVVLLVHIPLAIITAARGGGIVTRLLKRLTFGYGLLAGALPDFWLGLLLIFIFFVRLHWTPGPEGRLGVAVTPPTHITGFYTIDALLTGNFNAFRSAAAHLVLPVVTLSFVYGAPIYKMARSTMTAALRSDYTTYAEGLGLPRWRVLWYAWRNASPPVVVMFGVISGYLLGGAVLIETVFDLNGIGQYAVQAITTSDYAPIQAFVLVAAVFTVLVYLVVDLIHYGIDPRVRRTRKA
ncbi:MAG TPA: ABC transporter permease [Candidatus Dormibacteraeota bacterium]|nr:ABC transporter permease [Candidatus Dormibacteraeota bacterium]